jgi:NAD dependent epimerase/dehydratase family enzyme
MAAFCQALGGVLGRPSWLPIPRLALRLALGEVADVLAKGQFVHPRRAQALGYAFRFPTAEEALRNILSRS